MEESRDTSCRPTGLQSSPLPDSLVDGTRPLNVILRLEGECFRAFEKERGGEGQRGNGKRKLESRKEAEESATATQTGQAGSGYETRHAHTHETRDQGSELSMRAFDLRQVHLRQELQKAAKCESAGRVKQTDTRM